jgi:hypothetical protein
MTVPEPKQNQQLPRVSNGPAALPPRLFVSLGITVVACLLGYHGFLELFTKLAFYDDTGYMLSLIKSFNENGHLYKSTFSQYGPFYSEFYYLVSRVLRVPPTHDGIRWVVLVLWVYSSIAGAILAFRLTGRISIAIIAQLLCFHVLNMLAQEPGHPLSLIIVCFGTIILCLDGRRSVDPNSRQAIIIGLCLGALLMMKINLGLFAVAAVGTAWIFYSPLDRWGKIGRCAAALLFCAPLLMIGRGWPVEARTFFIVLFVCSLLSVLTCPGYETLEWKVLLRSGALILAGLIVTSAVCLSVAVLSGSSWNSITEGVIVSPMRLGSLFSFVPAVGLLPAINAILGLFLAIIWRSLSQACSIDETRFILGLRVFFLTIVIIWLATSGYYFFWVQPFLWIAALPLDSDAKEAEMSAWRLAQLSLTLLAVGQVLGLYPVGGAQITAPIYLGATSTLFVIAGLLVDLKAIAKDRSFIRLAAKTAVYIVLPLVLIGLIGQRVYRGASHYAHLSSLNLPGAQLLRIEDLPAATYRFLVANLEESRPSFLTVPGLNSLYGWTHRDPPTGFNATMNFALLSRDQQRAMTDVGRTCRPIAAVLNREILDFWADGNFRPSGPLIDFVARDCRSVGRVNRYELMILRDSPPPTFTSCVTLDQEWRANAPVNQITIRPPAHLGRITSVSLLNTTQGTVPGLNTTIPAWASESREFSLQLEAPIPSRDSLDQMLVQLADESNHVVMIPFLRPSR